MQLCGYCGRENGDEERFCHECGLPLTKSSDPLPTPHRVLGKIQLSIWEHFAVKRKQFYLAGLFIGMFAAIIGLLKFSERGFQWWLLPVGPAMGFSGVWFLSFTEKLQARIEQRRREGKPVLVLGILFGILGLMALIIAALIVAAAGMLI